MDFLNKSRLLGYTIKSARFTQSFLNNEMHRYNNVAFFIHKDNKYYMYIKYLDIKGLVHEKILNISNLNKPSLKDVLEYITNIDEPLVEFILSNDINIIRIFNSIIYTDKDFKVKNDIYRFYIDAGAFSISMIKLDKNKTDLNNSGAVKNIKLKYIDNTSKKETLLSIGMVSYSRLNYFIKNIRLSRFTDVKIISITSKQIIFKINAWTKPFCIDFTTNNFYEIDNDIEGV